MFTIALLVKAHARTVMFLAVADYGAKLRGGSEKDVLCDKCV